MLESWRKAALSIASLRSEKLTDPKSMAAGVSVLVIVVESVLFVVVANIGLLVLISVAAKCEAVTRT